MVEIRGQSVELGEIESGVLSHPGVAEGAVVILGDSVDAIGASSEELHEHRAGTVPRYMVPAEI
jgi:acyl-coenzyme A synthetase/AMP-(fatty) acid ligase